MRTGWIGDNSGGRAKKHTLDNRLDREYEGKRVKDDF